MSTPIENNTEELQNILQTVYNLPNAGGSAGIPEINFAELGFPEINEDTFNENNNYIYNQALEIDDSTANVLASKFEVGFVNIIVSSYGGRVSVGACCGCFESEPHYTATYTDIYNCYWCAVLIKPNDEHGWILSLVYRILGG